MISTLNKLNRAFARYRSLIVYQVYAELRAESERTYIGFMWWFVDPIVTMFVYYVVFTVVLNSRSENFLGFLFVGILSWRWFHTSIMHGANSILGARGLMQQVYLPKVIFPIVAVLTDTAKFLVVLLMLIITLSLFGFPIGIAHLALLPLFLTQLMLVAGCTIMAASIVPVVPDIRMVLQNGLQMMFFLSGIFYDISVFPEKLQRLLLLNPMAVLIRMYREVLLDGSMPDFTGIAAIAAFSFLIGMLGFLVTRRLDVVYPKLR